MWIMSDTSFSHTDLHNHTSNQLYSNNRLTTKGSTSVHGAFSRQCHYERAGRERGFEKWKQVGGGISYSPLVFR